MPTGSSLSGGYTDAQIDAALESLADNLASRAIRPTRVFYVTEYGAVVYSTQAAAIAGTDSTTAIQAALDAAAAASGGKVVFDPGFYQISGPLVTTRRGNAQIALPIHDEDAKIAISLYCHEPAAAATYPHGADSTSNTGAILVSTLTGQTFSNTHGIPSVVGGPTPEGSGEPAGSSGMPIGGFSNLYFSVKGVAVRTQANPTLTAWDCGGVLSGYWEDLRADTTDVGSVIATAPTSVHAWGFIAPRANNNVMVAVGNINVVGYYAGVSFSEHLHFRQGLILYCVVALVPQAMGHAAHFVQVKVERCTRTISYVHPSQGLGFLGAAPAASFDLEHLGIENVIAWSAENWWGTLQHLNDGFNAYTGTIRYAFAGGYVTPFLNLGGDRMTLYDRRTQQYNKLGIGPDVQTALDVLAGDPMAGGIAIPSVAPVVIPHNFNGVTYYIPAYLPAPVPVVFHTFSVDDPSGIPTPDIGPQGVALLNTWGVTAGEAHATGATGGGQYGPYVWDSGRADCTIECDITLSPHTDGTINCGLIARAADINNFWMLEFLVNAGANLNTITLYKKVAGGYGGTGQTVNAGLQHGVTYRVEMVLAGTTIAVRVDGVQKFAWTEAAGLEANTKHGIMQSYFQDGNGVVNGASRFDNFKVTS